MPINYSYLFNFKLMFLFFSVFRQEARVALKIQLPKARERACPLPKELHPKLENQEQRDQLRSFRTKHVLPKLKLGLEKKGKRERINNMTLLLQSIW